MPSIKGHTYEMLGATVTQYVKFNPDYPYKTGHLRDDATTYRSTKKGFEIVFNEENTGSGAPYIPALELGVQPGFRISSTGKSYYHSGSTKHVGFISVNSYKSAQDTLCFMLGGRVENINIKNEYSINFRGFYNVAH